MSEGNDRSLVAATTVVIDRNALFENKVIKFIHAMLSWRSGIPLLISHLLLMSRYNAKKAEKIGEIFKDKGESSDTLKAFARFKAAAESSRQTMEVFRTLPDLSLSVLITEYDILMSGLFGNIIECKPEILKGSRSVPDFAEIFKLNDMEAVRRLVVDREIDAFGRDSRSDQIARLRNISDVQLINYLPNFPTFVEITERRNLFIHTGGIVNEQYLDNCRVAGVKLAPECVLGTQLDISIMYLFEGISTILETGVVVSHLLWRKFATDGGVRADMVLSELGYQLIYDKKYAQAIRILTYACKRLKKHSSDLVRRMMLVNLCNALRLAGKKSEAGNLLDDEDWSSSAIDFKLAIEIIKEKYELAAKTMREIGMKGERVNRMAYHQWPLFRGFSETEEFKNAYLDIFGESFEGTEEQEADRQAGFIDNYKAELTEMLNELKEEIRKVAEQAKVEEGTTQDGSEVLPLEEEIE